MTRSDAGSAHRRQRATPLQRHQQHDRRQRTSLSSTLPYRPAQRVADTKRPSSALARRSPERNGSSERRRDDDRIQEHGGRRELFDDRGQRFYKQEPGEQDLPRGSFLQQQQQQSQQNPQARAHQLAGYERERCREDERRLSTGPRELISTRKNIPMQLAGSTEQLTRAFIHEENRAVELTRLNAVVVQRNNTIAEANRQIERQQEEISRLKSTVASRLDRPISFERQNVLAQKNEELKKMHQALGSRTEMAVALHDICSRQQEFLRTIGGGIYAADDGRRLQFNAWINGSELYLAHVKSQVAFETNWEDMLRRANAVAIKEIGKAAQTAAQQALQHVAQPSGLQAVHQSGTQHTQHEVQQAVEQLIQETTEDLDRKSKGSGSLG